MLVADGRDRGIGVGQEPTHLLDDPAEVVRRGSGGRRRGSGGRRSRAERLDQRIQAEREIVDQGPQGVADEPVGARRKSPEEGWTERIEFPEDAWQEPLLLAALRGMLERVMARVRAAGVEVRRLTLELRYTDRAESRYSLDLPEPSCTEDDALPRLPAMLEGAWTRRVRIRAMTLRAGRVYQPGTQLALFEINAEERERRRRAAAVLDAVRKRFGAGALVRGADLLDKTLAPARD